MKIIINADDYGLSKEFNGGILELAGKRIISSITVMINRKYVKPLDLLTFKNISVGLHLELKEKASLEEIESQVKKFKNKFKKIPSHLDGHKHCHLTKNNLPKVIRIAQRYNLPVRSKLTQDRKMLREYKIKTPDRFISWHPKRKERFFNRIKNIKSPACEIVCHPGYFDKNYKHSYNKQREQELRILKSGEFKTIIKKYKSVNYSGL